MSYLRPASPYETAPIAKRSADDLPSARLSIGRVLARSLEAVRRQWLTLALLTYGLGFLPRLVLSLGFHPHVQGPADLPGLGTSLGRAVAIALCLHFARAAVTNAVVRPADGPLATVVATLTALPALAPMWFASEYDTFWTYFNFWASPFWVAHPNFLHAEARILLPLLAALVIGLGSAAMLGVLTPVVIAERLSLQRAIGRCWALMRGNRWRIVALCVLVSAALVLLSFPATWLRLAVRTGDPNHVYATLEWVQSAVFEALDAFLAVVLASAYLELLRIERGVPENEIAEVFA